MHFSFVFAIPSGWVARGGSWSSGTKTFWIFRHGTHHKNGWRPLYNGSEGTELRKMWEKNSCLVQTVSLFLSAFLLPQLKVEHNPAPGTRSVRRKYRCESMERRTIFVFYLDIQVNGTDGSLNYRKFIAKRVSCDMLFNIMMTPVTQSPSSNPVFCDPSLNIIS